eukprot:7778158-Ditylum_brightwellii.AAC.1
MEKSATEMAKWRTTFDAKQKKRFKEQDKKMTKKLDAQTLNFDNKMAVLATSVQEQLSTNQNSLQQMMQEHCNHLDAKIIMLLGSLQNKHGLHNKRQKHSNMDADSVEVMEALDALCCNRDACAPDPGGTGGP